MASSPTPSVSMLLLLAFAAYFPPIMSQVSSSFAPPAVPLAVKGPYLNAWMLRRDTNLTNWPTFWNTDTSVASFTAVVVDNSSFGMQGAFFGTPSSMHGATQLGFIYGPSSTTFMMQAGPMFVNATFLSPVTPQDLSQQSLPLSYYALTFQSNDSQPHSVQVYSDFTSEWIASGSNKVFVNGSSIVDKDLVCLETQLTSPTPFSETVDFAEDSLGIYAAEITNIPGVQWEIGNFTDVRGFGLNGTGLSDSVDPTFSQHAQFSPPNALGFLADLGSITDTSSTPFVIAYGAIRNPSIQVTDLAGEKQLRSPYYMSSSTSGSIHDITLSFVQNYTKAQAQAQAFDSKLLNDTITISESQPYVDLVALAVRGAMSSMEITLPFSNQGKWDFSDIEAHLKDMGGLQTGPQGSSGTVNPVDVLYAATPMYLYLNPDLLGYLLKPLLEAQQNPAYSGTIGFAAQNLGTQFPQVQLQVASHKFGIEQSSNMLIMSLAHAQTTGDGTLISTYYTLLRQWAEYLVDNALSPNGQSSPVADAITYTNQTNLALKGITAIAAMGKISSLLNNNNDQSRYEGISKDYISQWQTLAVSSDSSHLLLSYGQQSCGGLVYNLYADKLLQLDLVPEQIYQMQTTFHKGQLDSGTFTFGLPLDTCNANLSRVDWTMFTAAVMTDSLVRNGMIQLVHQYAGNMFNKSTNAPLMTVYDPTTGNNTFGTNSATLGSMFSLLALQVPIKTSASVDATKHPRAVAGIIAGSVVGGLVLITLIFWFARRWLLKRKREDIGDIPVVVSEREDIRTPFLLGGGLGRTRKASPIDELAELEVTPFELRPAFPPSEGSQGSSQLESSDNIQSTDPTSYATTSYISTDYLSSTVQTSEPTPDRKPPIIHNDNTVSGSSTSAVVDSSNGDGARSPEDATEAAYWRNQAEILRSELAELARIPGDLPPGYSPNDSEHV